jgi:septal ring factor EnvC (AmiA/AmiB activator)
MNLSTIQSRIAITSNRITAQWEKREALKAAIKSARKLIAKNDSEYLQDILQFTKLSLAEVEQKLREMSMQQRLLKNKSRQIVARRKTFNKSGDLE